MYAAAKGHEHFRPPVPPQQNPSSAPQGANNLSGFAPVADTSLPYHWARTYSAGASTPAASPAALVPLPQPEPHFQETFQEAQLRGGGLARISEAHAALDTSRTASDAAGRGPETPSVGGERPLGGASLSTQASSALVEPSLSARELPLDAPGSFVRRADETARRSAESADAAVASSSDRSDHVWSENTLSRRHSATETFFDAKRSVSFPICICAIGLLLNIYQSVPDFVLVFGVVARCFAPILHKSTPPSKILKLPCERSLGTSLDQLMTEATMRRQEKEQRESLDSLNQVRSLLQGISYFL